MKDLLIQRLIAAESVSPIWNSGLGYPHFDSFTALLESGDRNMLASPGCIGLYTALCFPILDSHRTISTRARDGRTQVLVHDYYSQGNSWVNGGTECMVAYHQDAPGVFSVPF